MDSNYNNGLEKADTNIENTSSYNAINNSEKNIDSNNSNEKISHLIFSSVILSFVSSSIKIKHS